MALQLTQPTRKIKLGPAAVDQFAAFAANGYDKTSGLTSSNWTAVVWCNGVVSAVVPTIAEIGSSGEYKVTLTPTTVGIWVVEVRISSLSLTWKGQYEVESVADQTFYDRVVNEHGAGIPYVTVEIFTAGTSTLLATTETAFDGSWSVDQSGVLAGDPLVDIRFSGNGILTYLKENVRLG